MAYVPKKSRGVFCLEGDWWYSLKRTSSVEPILELLRQWDPFFVPFIHRNVATAETLEYYLKKWAQKKHADYPILYLAFHGNPGTIYIGDMRRRKSAVTLSEIADWLEGRCKGRIIYFGTCATMDLHGHHLNRFLGQTGALAVCGYTDEVDWLRATAFELLVFAAMQNNALTVSGANAMKRRVFREAGYLVKELNFRMIVARPSR